MQKSIAPPSRSRAVIAALAGYVANGALVAGTEAALNMFEKHPAQPSLQYYVIDLFNQCLCTVVAGYLCRWLTRSSQKTALFWLVALGVVVGATSVITSWKAEPHWYAIILLAEYSPCAWIGWRWKDQTSKIRGMQSLKTGSTAGE